MSCSRRPSRNCPTSELGHPRARENRGQFPEVLVIKGLAAKIARIDPKIDDFCRNLFGRSNFRTVTDFREKKGHKRPTARRSSDLHCQRPERSGKVSARRL